MAAAKSFFRSARTVTGVTPSRVTTDAHDSYPRAIRAELGRKVRHRTSQYLNNRIEQDHRGIKGRYRPMRGSRARDRRLGSAEDMMGSRHRTGRIARFVELIGNTGPAWSVPIELPQRESV